MNHITPVFVESFTRSIRDFKCSHHLRGHLGDSAVGDCSCNQWLARGVEALAHLWGNFSDSGVFGGGRRPNLLQRLAREDF